MNPADRVIGTTGVSCCGLAIAVRFSCSVLMALLAAGGLPARGDEVTAEGRPTLVDVSELEIRGATLQFRLRSGRVVTRPLSQVAYIQIDGWPLFNVAEKQQRDGELRLSAQTYEHLIEELTAPEAAAAPGNRGADVDRAGRLLLARCRLLSVYDRLGRFDLAVDLYLDLIEQMPAAAADLRPRRLPTAQSTFLDEASRLVEAAIERHRGDAVGEMLARWRAAWPDRLADEARERAASRPADDSPLGRTPTADLEQRLERIASLVETGSDDQALELIAPLQTPGTDLLRAELYYWQGRALASRARKNPEAAEASTRDRRRAGLAFMRVVIHFPGHERAPECLYHAGELCRVAGNPELASALWRELLARWPEAHPWADRAQTDMTQLSAADGAVP